MVLAVFIAALLLAACGADQAENTQSLQAESAVSLETGGTDEEAAATSSSSEETASLSGGIAETDEEPVSGSMSETIVSASSEQTAEEAAEAFSEAEADGSDTDEIEDEESVTVSETGAPEIEEDGEYTSKDKVALYIHTYGRLPKNYISKKKAEQLGWDNREGNLWEVAPGKSIGGSYFGNYEGALPEKNGREYHECDIDYNGGRRNAKRIVYSDDGLIFYTEDHYETFEQLY